MFQSEREGVFVIQKVKYIVLKTYTISDFNDEESIGTFYGKKLEKKSNRV